MNYSEWCSQSDAELADCDVALLNLTAAVGLPGAESIHVPTLIRRVDHWTSLVEINTTHWLKNFTPTDDYPTENQYRMAAMVTLLQRDLGVGYNPVRMTGPYNAMDSRDNFLHGPLSGHGGTCCSLPILYLAVGRRLGYSLHLVSAREHSFVRWDDGKERFNIECAGVGFGSHSDEYYKRWPKPLSAKNLATGHFLRNHTPREVLANFISNRGHCFMDNLKVVDALEAFMHASQLDKRYEAVWAVTSMAQRILLNMKPIELPTHVPLIVRIDVQIETASPRPKDPWERWALPQAQRDLLRIALLHAKQKPDVHFEPATYFVTAE